MLSSADVKRYSSGPKIKPADIQIHELYRKYCKEPVFLIMEVQPKENELPMEAYYSLFNFSLSLILLSKVVLLIHRSGHCPC